MIFDDTTPEVLVKQWAMDALRDSGVRVKVGDRIAMTLFGERTNIARAMEAAKRSGSVAIDVHNKLWDTCSGVRIGTNLDGRIIPCDGSVRPPPQAKEEGTDIGDPPTLKKVLRYHSSLAILDQY